MKKISLFVLLTALFLTAGIAGSQAQDLLHFNHQTLYVVDLQKSGDFYDKVLMLKKIPEPFHDNRHNWYQISDHGELHVVKGATAITDHNINIHLCFSSAHLEDFMKHLDDLHIKYGNWAQT